MTNLANDKSLFNNYYYLRQICQLEHNSTDIKHVHSIKWSKIRIAHLTHSLRRILKIWRISKSPNTRSIENNTLRIVVATKELHKLLYYVLFQPIYSLRKREWNKRKSDDGQLRPKIYTSTANNLWSSPPTYPKNAWIIKFQQIEHDLGQFKQTQANQVRFKIEPAKNPKARLPTSKLPPIAAVTGEHNKKA